MRICSQCGAENRNYHFTRCIDCSSELVVPAPTVQDIPPNSVEDSSAKAEIMSDFQQLAFFNYQVVGEEVLPLSIIAKDEDNSQVLWPPQSIPKLVGGVTVPSVSKKSAGGIAYAPKQQLNKKNCEPMSAKQAACRNAIILALLLGWCGAHRRYIGDGESFVAFLLFGLLGGLLTAGITTVFAQLVAYYDAFLLLTGKLEVDEGLVHLNQIKLVTVFSKANVLTGRKY